MIKKIAFAGVGLAMLASPLFVSAQTVSANNASLIAALTALVQILEQEIQQLIAAQQGTAQSSPVLLTATPASGTAPLTVEFHINPSAASANSIDFGDDKTNVEALGNSPGNSCGDPNTSECAHTYTTSGTYTAHVYDVKSEVLGTATITVTGSGITQPSASLDVGNMSFSTGGKDAAAPMITGGASNVSLLQVSLDGADGVPQVVTTSVTNGRWQVTMPSVYPGTHSVTVIDADSGSSYAHTLTTGTLTVSAPQTAAPTINSISPNTATTNTSVTMYGTNLSGASGIQVYNSSGTVVASLVLSSVTPTDVSFTLYGSFLGMVGPGTYQLAVVTPTGTSNTLPLTVTSPSIPPQTNPVVINSFGVSSSTVNTGQSVTFSWSSNLSATDVSYYGGGCYVLSSANSSSELNAVGNSTNYGASGSFSYTPTATATYTLECLSGGKDGSPTNTSPQITVVVNTTPSCIIAEQAYGSGYGLTWTSQNAVTAHLSPIPAMGGTSWANASLNNSDPSSWNGPEGLYTLTVWNSSGQQAVCTTNGVKG
jgi:hypothetical protein